MRSLVVAVVAGVVLGMVERVVFYNWSEPARPHGGPAVRRRARRGAHRPPRRGPEATAARGRCRTGWRRCPTDCARTRWCGGCPGCPALLALATAIVVPLVIDSNAKYFLYSRMALIAIVVVSVTILTGLGRTALPRPVRVRRPRRHDHGRRRHPPEPPVPARRCS